MSKKYGFRSSDEWLALRKLLDRGLERPAARPLLWVGAGSSIIAGYPSTRDLIKTLREGSLKPLPPYRPFDESLPLESPSRSFDRWIEAYIDSVGRGELDHALWDIFRHKKRPGIFHQELVCLPWRAILTTNYDELLEDALDMNRQDWHPSSGDANLEFGDAAGIHLHKIHGSTSDLKDIVFSRKDYDDYPETYPFSYAKLEIEFLQKAIVFVGCSMTDPRILSWLRRHAGRSGSRRYSVAILTENDWLSIPSNDRDMLVSGRIAPLLLNEHSELQDLVSILYDEYSTCSSRLSLHRRDSVREVTDHERLIGKGDSRRIAYDTLLYEGIVGPIIRAVPYLWLGSRTPVPNNSHHVTELLRSVGGVRAFRRFNRLLDPMEDAIQEVVDSIIRVTVFRSGGATDEGPSKWIEQKLDCAKECASFLEEIQIQRARVEELLRSPAEIVKEVSQDYPKWNEMPETGKSAIYQIIELIIELFEALPIWREVELLELLGSPRLLSGVRRRIDDWKNNIDDVSRREHSPIEARYLRAIAREYDRLELFGIDAPREALRHQLSVAFVQLALESDFEPGERQFADLVSSSAGLLLLGEAGGGKTTLLKWAAVKCAQRRVANDQQRFALTMIPFFVRLREWVQRDSLPKPEEIVRSALGAELQSKELEVWSHGILEQGRGLILIDGFDEVPVDQREEVIGWISHMKSEWPDSKLIVSSRPQAGVGRLARELQITKATIMRLGPRSRGAFIDHWHKAVFLAGGPENERRIEISKRYIKRKLRRDLPLRNLATNPLMQAVLCALNYRRYGSLPATKREICEQACRLLLSSRDKARGVPEPSPIWGHMRYEILESLLGSVAEWMMTEGFSAVGRDQVLKILGSRIIYIKDLGGDVDPKRLFDLIMQRTGFLRELTYNQFEFSHKIFQEYLAAKLFVSEGRKKPLRDSLLDDQWAETIELAVSLMDKIDALNFIRFMISEARKLRTDAAASPGKLDSEPGRRSVRLDLLLIRCFNSRSEMEPRVAEEIVGRIRFLIPPRKARVRAALIESRDAAVPYLASRSMGEWKLPEALYTSLPHHRLICARILADIETESAYWQLGDYFQGTKLAGQVTEDSMRFGSREESFRRFSLYVTALRQLAADLDADVVKSSELMERFRNEDDVDDTILLDLAIKSNDFFSLKGKAIALSRIDLDLGGTAISDLRSLRVFEMLEFLDISDTLVKDLSPLLEMKSLLAIDISNTEVNNLMVLCRHPTLERVRAVGVTGVEELVAEADFVIVHGEESYESG